MGWRPRRDQGRRREAEVLGAEERGHRDVAACAQLAVCLQGDAASEAVENQRLVRLCDAKLPARARALDA